MPIDRSHLDSSHYDYIEDFDDERPISGQVRAGDVLREAGRWAQESQILANHPKPQMIYRNGADVAAVAVGVNLSAAKAIPHDQLPDGKDFYCAGLMKDRPKLEDKQVTRDGVDTVFQRLEQKLAAEILRAMNGLSRGDYQFFYGSEPLKIELGLEDFEGIGFH